MLGIAVPILLFPNLAVHRRAIIAVEVMAVLELVRNPFHRPGIHRVVTSPDQGSAIPRRNVGIIATLIGVEGIPPGITVVTNLGKRGVARSIIGDVGRVSIVNRPVIAGQQVPYDDIAYVSLRLVCNGAIEDLEPTARRFGDLHAAVWRAVGSRSSIAPLQTN